MTLLSIRTGGLLLFLTGLLLACETKTPQHSEVFILIDQTESFIQEAVNAQRTVDFITRKTNTDLSELTSNSFDLTIYPLTDLEHNKRIEVHLPKGAGMMTEIKKKRLGLQEQFRKDIINGINEIKQDTSTKKCSKLVKPLCDKLRILSQKEANRKLVLLFSDLFEYNSNMSFYSGSIKSIKEQLQKTCACGDLSGIAIYCVYETDQRSDTQFGVVKEAFQLFIEEANGTFSYVPHL